MSVATRRPMAGVMNTIKDDIDSLRQQIEEYREAEDSAKTPGELPVKSGNEFDDAIRNFKNQIEALQNNITFVERCKQYYSTMLFKPGDAAFHKIHGNILIKGVLINQSDLAMSRYTIITQDGQLKVPQSDLMPITEATKVLFKRNK